MKRIKWMDTVSNKEALNRLKENRTLLDIILKKKEEQTGHIIRGMRRLILIEDVKKGGHKIMPKSSWGQ